MPNSRASKDLIYRAKGLFKHVAGKLKKRQQESRKKLKEKMDSYGYNP